MTATSAATMRNGKSSSLLPAAGDRSYRPGAGVGASPRRAGASDPHAEGLRQLQNRVSSVRLVVGQIPNGGQ
jgi:hypothetical protein